MNQNNAIVTATIDTYLTAAVQEPVEATFIYDPADPHAVTAYFTTREGGAPWSFARDLLRDGMLLASGEGNVRVRPTSLRARVVHAETGQASTGQTDTGQTDTGQTDTGQTRTSEVGTQRQQNAILLDLRSQEGRAQLVCNRTQLLWFLDQAFATVPDGDEHLYMEVDDWLARLSI